MEIKWLAIAMSVLFVCAFTALGVAEYAKPAAIEACMAVEGMEYYNGNCRPIDR